MKKINKYLTSKYFDVVQYSSTNRNALVDTIQNPSKWLQVKLQKCH